MGLYNSLTLVIILIFTATAVFFAGCFFIMVYTYKKKKISKFMAKITVLGIIFTRWFIMYIAEVLKVDTLDVKAFFIELNNIIVKTNKRKYEPHEVLLILPHCIQYHECTYKITGVKNNCKMCGKCEIGDITKMCKDKQIALEVVTGGTAARNVIKSRRPKVIFAVACERDLFMGIVDVRVIPVIGIKNEQPNGPCFDTKVDVKLMEKEIDSILK